jgi:hypothetical protein
MYIKNIPPSGVTSVFALLHLFVACFANSEMKVHKGTALCYAEMQMRL